MDFPETRIRSYLDDHGGSAEVTFQDLLTTWRIEQPTEADYQRIEEALRSVGIEAEPSVHGLSPGAALTLRIPQQQDPPWGAPAPEEVTPPPPEPPAPAPPPPPEPTPPPPPPPTADPAPPPVASAVPPSPPPAAGPTAFGSGAPGMTAGSARGVTDLIGLLLGVAGAALALLASFLPWLSAGFGESVSYWELTDAADVFLLLTALAVVGVGVVAAVFPRVRILRILALALVAGMFSFVFPDTIEIMAQSEGRLSTMQAGEFLSLFAGLLLIGSAALQVIALQSERATKPRILALLLAGLVTLAFVGLIAPLVALLPVENGVSAWEESKVSDILHTLVYLGMTAVAIAAIFLNRTPALAAVAFFLASYVAIGSFVASIESLAREANGAAVFLFLLVITPLATAGAVVIAIGSRLLRRSPAGDTVSNA